MKTIEVNLYSFSELSAEAQQNAIEKTQNSESYLDYNWYESVIEHHKELIQAAGFDVDKIYFSGFWSQGDGAMFEYNSFEGEILLDQYIDQLNLSPMRKNWIKNNIYVSGKGTQSGHYYHERSCSHSINWEVDNGDLHYSRPFYQWLESIGEDFEDFVTKIYIDLAQKLYKALETEYNDLKSDETVKDYLMQDEFQEYTEDGEKY
jgi:hypothetical protein